ncbi:MAG: 50S ribosomal protein L1 [Candidatus Bipolaricaulia bacterium]
MNRRYEAVADKVDSENIYSLDDGIELVKETATAEFDETIDVAFNMGVNPSQNMIRGSTVLPNGTGKDVKVLAFAKGEARREAEEAGADYLGDEETVEEIEDGWLEFDEVVSTPDMMSLIGRLGRILGPRGMMPSPKSNTVSEDIGEAVSRLKKGQVEFRADKYGVIHVPVGKASFSTPELRENLVGLAKSIYDQRPEEGIQDRYVKKVTVSPTMGPGLKLSVDELRDKVYERKV